jgi:cytochrome c2
MSRRRHALAGAACAVLVSFPVQAQDAVAGRAVFQQQCGICHAAVSGQNAAGPSLFGIVNRKAGAVEGFSYSLANKSSGMVWTMAALDLYLLSPHDAVPDTIMPYGGLKDGQKRADLIAYLATLH